MKGLVALLVLGTASAAFADDRDLCVVRRHVLEERIRQSPPSAQIELEKELPVCDPTAGQTPPLSGGRLAGEAALGSAFAVAGAFAGALIGFEMETSGGCSGDWCGFGGLIIGGYLGGTLAAPIGVYIVGASGDQTGSPAGTVLGALLGGAGGLALGIPVGRSNGTLGFAIAAAGPVVGAMVGFNLTRSYRPDRAPVTAGSLLQLDRGRVGLGVPVVVRSAQDHFVGLSLASGSF